MYARNAIRPGTPSVPEKTPSKDEDQARDREDKVDLDKAIAESLKPEYQVGYQDYQKSVSPRRYPTVNVVHGSMEPGDGRQPPPG